MLPKSKPFGRKGKATRKSTNFYFKYRKWRTFKVQNGYNFMIILLNNKYVKYEEK